MIHASRIDECMHGMQRFVGVFLDSPMSVVNWHVPRA
jgi:hypothetical protein